MCDTLMKFSRWSCRLRPQRYSRHQVGGTRECRPKRLNAPSRGRSEDSLFEHALPFGIAVVPFFLPSVQRARDTRDLRKRPLRKPSRRAPASAITIGDGACLLQITFHGTLRQSILFHARQRKTRLARSVSHEKGDAPSEAAGSHFRWRFRVQQMFPAECKSSFFLIVHDVPNALHELVAKLRGIVKRIVTIASGVICEAVKPFARVFRGHLRNVK